jgi:hypothetical protein
VLNLNVNWDEIGGTPLDAALFVTNVTKEKTFLHVNVQVSSGFLSHIIGEPRMWGAPPEVQIRRLIDAWQSENIGRRLLSRTPPFFKERNAVPRSSESPRPFWARFLRGGWVRARLHSRQ